MKIGLLLFFLVAALPAWYFNKFLLNTIQPKRSFRQLMIYMLASLAMAFLYTILLVFILLKFVGPTNK